MHQRPQPASVGRTAGVAVLALPSRTGERLLRRSDKSGFATDFDAAWLRFTERSLEASLRLGWLEDVHPDDRASCRSIHVEMQALRGPYSLDYRLRHGPHGYRWFMEHASPVASTDGGFDGFVHHCIDIHERTELAEDLADRLGRVRRAVRSHGAIASALSAELERLPPTRIRVALELFASLVGQPGRPQASRRPVAQWFGRIIDAAHAALEHGAFRFSLALPAEPLEVDFDSAILSAAFTNALVCVALQTGEGLSAEASQVIAARFDGALLLDLPACPGSSAFALLELALRAQGLSGGQLEQHDGIDRWHVALPVAEAAGGGLPATSTANWPIG